MKKNIIMRFATLALILTIVSLTMVSGTFAKYTYSSGPITDSVRVARFDFTVADGGGKIFTQNNAQKIDIFYTNPDNIINGEYYIGPGDSGDFDVMVVNASEVTVEAEISAELHAYQKNTDVAIPEMPNIRFTLKENAADSEYDLLSNVISQINTSSTFKDIPFPAVRGSTEQASTTIYWKWIPNATDNTLAGETVIRMDVSATVSQVD